MVLKTNEEKKEKRGGQKKMMELKKCEKADKLGDHRKCHLGGK